MAKPYDARLIAVVAQDQFEVELNRFCKLAPIVFVDGGKAEPSDFPNDGELWWMLSAPTSLLATPGRLLSCRVEDAYQVNERDLSKSLYQAQRESVRDLDLHNDGLEILTIPSDAVENVQDLVSAGYQTEFDHRPSPTVLLRWRGDVYGPFLTTAKAAQLGLKFYATFAPVSEDMTVYRVGGDFFRNSAGSNCLVVSMEVSPTNDRRSENSNLQTLHYELLLASGFEQVLATHPDKLVLEPLDRKLVRLAKQCLTRRKRQDLRALLDELDVAGQETEDAQGLIDAILRIRKVTDKQDAALDSVSKALLESGILGEDRLRRAEQEFASKYIQERTAELQAKIEKSISSKREELKQVEADVKDVQTRLQRQESEARLRLTAELEAETARVREDIDTEKAKLERDKGEFKRQEALLERNLEKVTRELREAGDDVVNRFLAIAPLLGSALFSVHPGAVPVSTRTHDVAEEKTLPTFVVPTYVSAKLPACEDILTEEEFFDRFRRAVEDNGFTYRLLDLQRFHVSVKCSDLTILGGPSGTGKSSLPSLYARAILGSDSGDDRTGCLMININPSWMDTRDLLGHVNTLERRFFPAESGLFQHLVLAQEEHSLRSDSTGLYFACLDEMNLAQVEHYFSDIMMVLERREAERTIRCFSEDAISEQDAFRKWGTVMLAPSIRFVGTVNFDETTRLLSDRLLDRVNVVRLASGSLPSLAQTDGEWLSRAEGRMVTLADFQAWIKDAALPSELGTLLDAIRPLLSLMGCPLSPRVYRAICRYVGSSENIMPAGLAFDAQIAQRMVPKIRNLITQSQLDSLDNLIATLEGSPVGTFDESLSLLAEVRESARAGGWDAGD